MTYNYSLSAYHVVQYKFLVDGAWRVDQQQRCDHDVNGTINNIVVVNGARVMSLDLNAEAFLPSTSGVNEDMSVVCL